MRSLRRLTFLFIVVMIGFIIFISGVILTKDQSPPVYLTNFDVEVSNQQDVSQWVSNVGTLDFNDELINQLIYNNAHGFENEYFNILGKKIQLKSLWTHVNPNGLIMYALVKFQGIETTLTLDLGIKDVSNGVQVKINSLKAGQLQLPKSLFMFLFNALPHYLGIDLEGTIQLNDSYLIENNRINQIIDTYLGTDLFQYQSMVFGSGQLRFNYDFNPEYLNNLTVDHSKLSDTTNLDDLSSLLGKDILKNIISNMDVDKINQLLNSLGLKDIDDISFLLFGSQS